MESWEADGLAVILVQSFPRSQIATDVWEAELLPLDKARAEEAVRRIRRTGRSLSMPPLGGSVRSASRSEEDG